MAFLSSNDRKDNENPEIFAVSQSKWDRHSSGGRSRRLTWSDMGSFQSSSSSSKTNTINTPYVVVPPEFDLAGGGGGFVDDAGIMEDGGKGGNGLSQNSTSGNNNNNSPFGWIPTTAEDKAILKNLTDISHATTRTVIKQKTSSSTSHDSGVNLLESCGGLVVPTKHISSEVLKLSSPVFPLVNATDDDGDDLNGVGGVGGVGDGDVEYNAKSRRKNEMGVPITTKGLDEGKQVKKLGDKDGDVNEDGEDEDEDEIDAAEVFDIIRNIQDPEHPHTLEELGVVSLEQVELLVTDIEDETTAATTATTNQQNQDRQHQKLVTVSVRFTPTIPHCSMATLIGLCLRVKLLRSLPSSRKFQICVQIEPGTHASENAINKQLRDKERVCAALENKHLNGVVNKCIKNE